MVPNNLIKDMISADQTLHSNAPEAAAKYNSKLLYHRMGKSLTESAVGL